ncbi:MAG: hypothetical protein CSA49_03390 [Gammaproteobacteria bacterium]|nr:MAG: hypothetical protein CSA49_03390 [Gammaproteobacteria bacterium]
MKHLIPISAFIGMMMTFALCASVQAAEQPASHYSQQAAGTKSAGKQFARNENKQQQPLARSAKHSYNPVWVANTWLDYVTDNDDDGYYQHFRFSFDADTSYAAKALFAEIYLSDGYNEWLVFTTETFWIHGNSGADVYEIATSLNEGYPAQSYDLTLRLYDADNHAVLAEQTWFEDPHLRALPLEDATQDSVFNNNAMIHHFELTLSDDFDGDNYFSQINMSVDVDSPYNITDVKIGIDIYDPINGWDTLYLSNEFTVAGVSSNDIQDISIDLENGFPSNQYQLKITVYESFSNALLASETLSQTVQLESLDFEGVFYDGYTEEYYVSAGYGGSTGIFTLALLAVGLLGRRLYRSNC